PARHPPRAPGRGAGRPAGLALPALFRGAGARLRVRTRRARRQGRGGGRADGTGRAQAERPTDRPGRDPARHRRRGDGRQGRRRLDRAAPARAARERRVPADRGRSHPPRARRQKGRAGRRGGEDAVLGEAHRPWGGWPRLDAARAQLDCRLLPGERPAEFLALLREVIADETIRVETLLSFPASSSDSTSGLMAAIRKLAATDLSGAPVIPSVIPGFTDSHYFRDHGL